MGMRLHVASTYRVEYADIEAFNWKQREFADLLEAAGIQYLSDYEWTTFEFFREDMERLIAIVRESEDLKVIEAVGEFEESRLQIADTLQQMLNAADENETLIHLKFL